MHACCSPGCFLGLDQELGLASKVNPAALPPTHTHTCQGASAVLNINTLWCSPVGYSQAPLPPIMAWKCHLRVGPWGKLRQQDIYKQEGMCRAALSCHGHLVQAEERLQNQVDLFCFISLSSLRQTHWSALTYILLKSHLSVASTLMHTIKYMDLHLHLTQQPEHSLPASPLVCSPQFSYLWSTKVQKILMENFTSKQFTSFKLPTVLSSMMESHAILHRQDRDHPFVLSIHTVPLHVWGKTMVSIKGRYHKWFTASTGVLEGTHR
jgi:hypothetical protein